MNTKTFSFHPLRRADETSLHMLSGLASTSDKKKVDSQGFVRGLGKALYKENSKLLKQARADVPFLNPIYFDGLQTGVRDVKTSDHKTQIIQHNAPKPGFFKKPIVSYVLDDDIDIKSRFYFNKHPDLFPQHPRQGVRALRDIALPHVEKNLLEIKATAISTLNKKIRSDTIMLEFAGKNLDLANKNLDIVENYKTRANTWLRAEKFQRVSSPIRIVSSLLTGHQLVSALRRDWSAGTVGEMRKAFGDIAGSHILASLGSRVGYRIGGLKLALPLTVVMGGLGSVYGQRLLEKPATS